MELSTERLTLRRFTPDDFALVLAWYRDPDVTRYLGGPKSRDDVETMMQSRILEYYDQHPGLGIWATVERASGACVGMHLLNHIHGEPLIQTGYIVAREYWGRGYATEMARAVVAYGFETLGLDRIHALTDVDHVASQRVLVKAGLERRGERSFSHPAYAAHAPFAWFERDREAWVDERATSYRAAARDVRP